MQKELAGMSAWQLMNLEPDDATAMAAEVAEQAGVESGEMDDLIRRHSLQSLGLLQFLAGAGLSSAGVVIAPASNHYSWPKACPQSAKLHDYDYCQFELCEGHDGAGSGRLQLAGS